MNGKTQILNTWKEIARYLDCGVRTVQRWEAELALPVRRPDGNSRSHVLAFRAEIDEWLKSTFSTPPFKNPKRLVNDHFERRISRRCRRHPEISELVLRIKAIRRIIIESHRALNVAEAQLEAVIYRLDRHVENSPQAELSTIARTNADHSSSIGPLITPLTACRESKHVPNDPAALN